jgi:hypothetical protein
MTTRELKTKVPEGRVTRQPMTRRNRLDVKDQDPNFHYRIVNDTDDRIEAFKAAGYEVVERPGKTSDARVDVPTGIGSSMISVGGGKKAVVMRIPKDWYKEDQKVKQAAIAETEDAMKQSAKSYKNGEFDLSSN